FGWMLGVMDVSLLGALGQRAFGLITNTTLIAIPVFVLMGAILEKSKIAEELLDTMGRSFGQLRGGLGISVVLVGALLAASTGIVGASVVLLAMLSMPIMLQQGYDKGLASGVVASAGTLGILIPPSIMLIIMADQLSMSVGNLFFGALVPGLMLGFLYIGYILLTAALRPRLAPAPQDLDPVSWNLVLDTLIAVLPPLGLIFAVLGSIFFGVATPTEASGLGAFGATLLALANGRLSLAVLRDVLRKTTITTAFIFGIFLGASMFAVVLRQLGGDAFIGDALKAIPFGPNGIVLTILFIAFLAGFFLDWLEISLIILPLVAPVVAALGFDLTWFVVLFAVTLQTSFLTPPVGFSLFYLKGVAPPEVTTMDIYRGVFPFVLCQVLAVALVFEFPALVLWLPQAMFGPS
ncbi:MAG: C4-dicarboxylate ABC transporter, partial [Alphaproteobacteria bacterium HGW-Alphaproteobacteria-10]